MALVSALADSPRTILQVLAETILAITQCDSAGLSLLTRDGNTPDVCGKRFYWPAIAGVWNPHVGGGRLALPKRIDKWSLTSLQQRLVKTGGRLVKHARYYWLLLAESHLTRRLFAAMLWRMESLPVPTG